MTNDKNCIDEFGNLIIDETKFYHVSNSPLSRCYKLIKTLCKPYQSIMLEKRESVLKAHPTYHIEFPSNLHTIYDKNEMDRIIKYEEEYDFWTDGSCQPNPGPAGAGYFSTNFTIKEKIYVIDHDTTINYAALAGVKMVLLSVWRYILFLSESNQSLTNFNVNINTDSQVVFECWIKIDIQN